MNKTLISDYRSQVSEFLHIFEESINYMYAKISPCILVTRYYFVLSFLYVYFKTNFLISVN
jgi:hypothetical protein